MKKILPASLQAIIVPFILIIVLVLLTLIVINIGFSRISRQREELSESGKAETILKTKADLLRSLPDKVLSQADASLAAVPDDNPALIVLAQLKNLAVAKGVTVSNFKVGNPISEGILTKIEVVFDVDGSLSQGLDFAKGVSTVAPITTLEKIKISQSQGASRINVALTAYSAGFPKTLPPLSEPIKELSADDVQLVTKLGNLTPPPFVKIAPTTGGRTDPFSF